MSDFKPIETQEALDEILKERLNRQEEKLKKQYEGYTSANDMAELKAKYEKQISDLDASYAKKAETYANYDKEKAELESKIATYETNSVKMRVAHETGLPFEMVDRLKGSNEEEIKKDAKALVEVIGKRIQVAPLANHEDKPKDDKMKKYKDLAKALRGEN